MIITLCIGAVPLVFIQCLSTSCTVIFSSGRINYSTLHLQSVTPSQFSRYHQASLRSAFPHTRQLNPVHAAIMTSTIGIPIKLLNEAQVCLPSNPRSLCQLLQNPQHELTSLPATGPHRHPRNHLRPDLPRQAPRWHVHPQIPTRETLQLTCASHSRG